MIQAGDCFLYYNKFKITDYTTWLAPFIRLGDRIYCALSGNKYSKYTHCGLILTFNGVLWVYETTSTVFSRSMPLEAYLAKYGKENFLFLRPKFAINILKAKAEADRMVSLNMKYDFIGIVDEAVYELTNERVWLGKEALGNTVFCTAAVGHIYNSGSIPFPVFKNPYELQPMDYYNSLLFSKI